MSTRDSQPISTGPAGRGGQIPIRTGTWALTQPRVDPERCNGCLLCWVFCPEGTLSRQRMEDGREMIIVDYDYCKGCGICEQECRRGAIVMMER